MYLLGTEDCQDERSSGTVSSSSESVGVSESKTNIEVTQGRDVGGGEGT